jgi:hypothetical protein
MRTGRGARWADAPAAKRGDEAERPGNRDGARRTDRPQALQGPLVMGEQYTICDRTCSRSAPDPKATASTRRRCRGSWSTADACCRDPPCIAATMRADELVQIPLSFPAYAGILGRAAYRAAERLNLDVGRPSYQVEN